MPLSPPSYYLIPASRGRWLLGAADAVLSRPISPPRYISISEYKSPESHYGSQHGASSRLPTDGLSRSCVACRLLLYTLRLAACSSQLQLQLSAQTPSSKLRVPGTHSSSRHSVGLCCGAHPGSLTRLGGAVDHAFSGATAWLCMHAGSTCSRAAVRSSLTVPVLVLRYHLLRPVFALPFPGASVSANSALEQFRLACRRRHAMTIQQVPGTPPHRAFLFLHQYYRTTSDRFRAFLEALEVVARKRFIPD